MVGKTFTLASFPGCSHLECLWGANTEGKVLTMGDLCGAPSAEVVQG